MCDIQTKSNGVREWHCPTLSKGTILIEIEEIYFYDRISIGKKQMNLTYKKIRIIWILVLSDFEYPVYRKMDLSPSLNGSELENSEWVRHRRSRALKIPRSFESESKYGVKFILFFAIEQKSKPSTYRSKGFRHLNANKRTNHMSRNMCALVCKRFARTRLFFHAYR